MRYVPDSLPPPSAAAQRYTGAPSAVVGPSAPIGGYLGQDDTVPVPNGPVVLKPKSTLQFVLTVAGAGLGVVLFHKRGVATATLATVAGALAGRFVGTRIAFEDK